jgi:Ca2+-binding RTX toxin-like protein
MTLSANEQYLLELINRARLDPLAEAARFGIDLNEGLAPGTIDGSQKQPLAGNGFLNTAAEGHSDWMLQTNIFSHTGVGGSDPGTRMANAGYVFSGPAAGSGENISWTGTTGTLDLEAAIEAQHEGLFLSEGHRENTLNGAFREVGLAQVEGQFTDEGTIYNASMLTQKFAFSGVTHFLTGVAYNDTDGDNFYSPGEGLAGVTFAIDAVSDVTAQAGGYSVGVTPGTNLVVAIVSGLFDATVLVSLDAGNVKLDLVDEEKLLSSGDLTLLSGVTKAELIGTDDTSLTGTTDNDELTGNSGDNLIEGLSGTDFILGGLGDDTLNGGGDTDALFGGDGADELDGEDGDDGLDGGLGNDTLDGGAGVDWLFGRENADVLRGGSETDALFGGAGDDLLQGDGGDDGLDGGTGSDTLEGGAGVDWLYGGDNGDVLRGGTETDALFGEAGNDALDGGAGDDGLDGGAGNDTLEGGEGVDWLYGSFNNDVLYGASAAVDSDDTDALFGQEGNDTLYGGGGGDNLDGGAGDDELNGGAGNDWMFGQGENDVLNGGGGLDVLFGNEGNDTLNGGADGDALDGGAGLDVLAGGAGVDVLFGGADADDFLFRATDEGEDLIRDFVTGEDRIVLDAAAFGIATGTLAGQGIWQTGAGLPADFGTGGPVLYFDTVFNALFYDTDGGTSGNATALFALETGTLTEGDIWGA